MAFIITQKTLFDYSEIEILGDLERFKLALEGIDDEKLMQKLEIKRKNGRDDYPVRVMWNLIIAMKVFEHKSVSSLRRECMRNVGLRKICGLNDHDNKKHLVPPERVFTGFLKLLMTEQEEAKNIFKTQVETLYKTIEGFGETLAGDGKYLDSYAKNKSKEEMTSTDNRSENDAEYSIKEYHYTDEKGNKKVKKETHYGFKAHIICDVATELPIAFEVTKGNYDEKKALTDLVEEFTEEQIKIAKNMLLDRGYDSIALIKLMKSREINPIIDIRNMWKNGEKTKQYKDTDIVYNAYGEVFFIDKKVEQHKMKYEGYDKQKKCLRYSHNGKIYKIYISYDERIFLPIARDSKKFKEIYKGRTTVERINGRLDRDYMFENHQIRGLKKMNLMVSIAMIVMNGMAVGKVKSNISTIRSLKTA